MAEWEKRKHLHETDSNNASYDDLSQTSQGPSKPKKKLYLQKYRAEYHKENRHLVSSSKGESCSGLRGWQKYVLFTGLIVYIIIPAIIFIFPAVAPYVVLSYSLPFIFGDLKHPDTFGLKAARHVDVNTFTGDTIGLWHILPDSAIDEKGPISDSEFDIRLASGVPIIIYVHGSGGSRGLFNRMYMYTTLRGQNWHVITFDFRGFADSTGKSTELNMAEDTVTVYEWVKKRAGSSPVYLWGHSLGSGVAVRAARILSKRHETLSGLVMEGAFNTLFDLVDVSWLTLQYRPFPLLLNIVKNALERQSMEFRSCEHICYVDCEVLILHAEDDQIIPVDLASKLLKSAKECRGSDQFNNRITMQVFPADKGYGHNGLHRIPDLGNVLKKFIDDSTKKHR